MSEVPLYGGSSNTLKDLTDLVGKVLYSKLLIQSKLLNECFDNTNNDHSVRSISLPESFKLKPFSYDIPLPACLWWTGAYIEWTHGPGTKLFQGQESCQS